VGLDFRRAADLFLASEQELAMALGIPEEELQRYRERPREAPPAIVARLGAVLVERGRGMARVGEMLQETAHG
jgi:hypothetical protein